MKRLIAICLFLSSVSYASDAVYCNGQRMNYAGDQLYPNGKRVLYAGDYLFPNGNRVTYAGDRLYPNQQRKVYAGDDMFMSGKRVVYAGDLLYPNGQRVVYAGDCYYQTGVRMASCPSTVRFIDRVDGYRLAGTLDLRAKKIVSEENYELREGNVTTYFSVDDRGTITNIDAVCE